MNQYIFYECFVFNIWANITIYHAYIDCSCTKYKYVLCFKNNISVKPKVFQDSFIWKKVVNEN